MKITNKFAETIKQYGFALLLIIPSFSVFLLFVLIPIGNTFRISFFSWDGIQPEMIFNGVRNYSGILVQEQFQKALINTVAWALMHILFACGTGLFIAFLITRLRRGKSFFRGVLFLPNVLALPVAAVIWAMMYNPTFGVVNKFLKAAGVGFLARGWLGDPSSAIYATSLASAWQAYGYYMVLFIAGLQNIDATLYEAARIDGAGVWHQFRHVTLPGLKNVLTFVLSVSIINGLMGFATVWTMTQGGPGYATYLLPLYIYRKAFVEYDFGHAAAGGVFLGVLIITITLFFNKLRDRE